MEFKIEKINNNLSHFPKIGLIINESLIDKYLKVLKLELGDSYDRFINNKKDINNNFYIEILSELEFMSLYNKLPNHINNIVSYKVDDLVMVGLGVVTNGVDKSYYIHCNSETIKRFREQFGFPNKDIFITLGFKYTELLNINRSENKLLIRRNLFLEELYKRYIQKENFNFLYKIVNMENDINSKINILSINDEYIKININEYIMDIGYDDTMGLICYTKYNKNLHNSPIINISTTEILKKLNYRNVS